MVNCDHPTSSPRQERFFLPAFVTRILTPRSRKSGYGLLLGCRSPLDAGPFEKLLFFDDVVVDVRSSNPKTGKIFTVCCGPASQSIGRGLIGREGSLDIRESWERRDKLFAEETENAIILDQNSETAIFSGEFSFLAAERYNFKTG